MPEIVMHYYCANEVFKRLPREIAKTITDKNLYVFASGGPDPFFFYKFWRFKENKRVADIGHYMHRNQIYDFFAKLTELTKTDTVAQTLLFSYLAGFITHHSLDSSVHPYVFYRTGVYDSSDETTDIYRGLHAKMEKAIDAHIIKEYYRQKPHRFNINCEILNLKKLPNELENSFNELYSLFDIEDGFKLVNESLKWQRRFYRFTRDPIGIKNFFFRLLDSKKMPANLAYISYYKKELPSIDILNLEKKIWYNPSDKNISSDLSVLELVELAKTTSVEKITKLYEYIFLDKDINLAEVLPRVNYLDAQLPEKSNMQYFDNIFA